MTLPREYIARFKPGENLPVYADDAAITAGRFVTITGKHANGAYKGRVSTAGEFSHGVAERSVPALGEDGRVTNNNGTNLNRRGAISRVEAGAAVTAGALVSSDGTGRAIAHVPPNTPAEAAALPTTPRILGRAITAATDAGDIIEVDLY